MNIQVNGIQKDVKDGITVAEFLEREQYQTGRIAVEINMNIIPKARYSETLLHSGDVVEVVSFVGGG